MGTHFRCGRRGFMPDEGQDRPMAGTTLLAAALGSVSASAKVDELLSRQIAISDLQIQDMRREDHLRHWSLRVRHISDVFKLSFEFGAALVLSALAVSLTIAIWTAAHDRALVIEAFNVPSDMAANGLTGQ